MFYRGKVMALAAAAFAIGGAFAAQPISVRADRHSGDMREVASPWVPGTNGVMSAYEPDTLPFAPPQ
jgi:hypothetical protein